ncbi:MAG: bifunctional (p)ppGpp synthetase/guanosine-3',5'-bis(diphosphate) 3'-pyrophosphohydrolase [Peptoniphilaceae bacterium]|nr:bifunctional (p)ppGpp synthetase/guanosine-3',5'-bis(diphosphate) 3'-pyrophosphohydrolase [Peptoniphilaceae bacterium]MDD7383455.1 bifunctional (p)ppGpp synthetase/guanosine-3',5'-bis(diphosphate) 3'-pyrophosphohydrolase [Peptoniphilaceae bacterium]
MTELYENEYEDEIKKLQDRILKYNNASNSEIIYKAFSLAKEKHRGQKRNSGEDYIIHPLAVANILADLKMDDNTICAGLMHDVLEDTDFTEEQMKNEFGEEITFLVNGVTKLKNLNLKSREEEQAENIRKMVMSMTVDPRVIVIKLSDRLHNMRTLEYKTEIKQKKTALETRDIYVPLAEKLGIYIIKSELEDLCFKYLDKENYYELAEMVNKKRREREEYVDKITEKINELLSDMNIDYEISGRPKSLYSIYKKMINQHIDFDQVYDLTAIRVIVNTIAECYAVLGKIHGEWKPLPNKIKDYIAQPKQNGYKSLHTTVFGYQGEPFEVQIRTKEMHRENEYGIAAHWRYKADGRKNVTNYDRGLNYMREFLEFKESGAEETSNLEFMDTLKKDFLADEIFPRTPKGKIINLPVGSTVVDFAYKVHTDVGNNCIGAKINGRIVQLDSKLQSDDIVSIITSKNSSGPSRDWLTFVKTNQAKTKIKQYFKKHERAKNIEIGKSMIIEDLRKITPSYKKLMKDDWLLQAANKLTFPTIDDMFASVGFGSTPTTQIIPKLKKSFEQEEKENLEIIDLTKKSQKRKKSGVQVRDMEDDDVEIHFAGCCNPVPGDQIVGYITNGKGISVHTRNCPNITNNRHPERLIDVYWENETNDKFSVKIQMIVVNHKGVLFDISKIISNNAINILAISSNSNEDGTAKINLTLEVKDTDQLNNIIAKLKLDRKIISIYRVNG